MLTILSGIAARDELKKSLAAKIKSLQEKQGSPSPLPLTLAIIQVGDRADSTAYINAKKKFADEIGVLVKLVQFKENADQEEIISEIKKLNEDKEISGIIVQLPLPKILNEQIILDVIDPAKDADAITSTNVKVWTIQGPTSYKPRSDLVQTKVRPCTNQGPTSYPATARGVGELLGFYKIPLKGKRVCVIGRSKFVGTPIACLCRAKGALVTVCHSKTEDLVKETLAADVIISVVGKAGLITAEHVRSGQVVVDVGLSRASVDGKTKLVGDVDFEKVKAVLGDSPAGGGAITPVPGGVGPMTVLALFENLVDCVKI
jgi:methylenetetrahydrofolate dehydrogenase (NADP+)/methenyltetrahydrofolate cyclohydrolase